MRARWSCSVFFEYFRNIFHRLMGGRKRKRGEKAKEFIVYASRMISVVQTHLNNVWEKKNNVWISECVLVFQIYIGSFPRIIVNRPEYLWLRRNSHPHWEFKPMIQFCTVHSNIYIYSVQRLIYFVEAYGMCVKMHEQSSEFRFIWMNASKFDIFFPINSWKWCHSLAKSN